MHSRARLKLFRYWQCTTCRFVSYSVAVTLVRAMVNNPAGLWYARRRARRLFRFLDRAGIEYDEKDTAVRLTMRRTLVPWARCRFARCPPRELKRWVEIRGMENLQPLLDGPGGVLLATCHFGAYHLTRYMLVEMGYTPHSVRDGALYRWFMNQYGLDAENLRLRGDGDVDVTEDRTPGLLRTTATVRDLLRRGELVTCAPDGNAGSSGGLELTLLGQRQRFRTGLVLAAALAGARIVFHYATLRADGVVEIRFDEPLPERPADCSPAKYAEDVIRDYVAKVQMFCESEPSSVTPGRFSRL